MLVSNKIIRSIFLIASATFILFTMSLCRLQDGTDIGTEESSPDSELFFFDYKDIIITTTSTIGTEIKNCNIYLDVYNDLIILGELENSSSTIKTDIELTIDFIGQNSWPIYTAAVPIRTDYLAYGARYPFHYYFTKKDKYIEIESVKIGVNYREYKDAFKGNPIAEIEEYYYEKDYLMIKGKTVNLGKGKIKNLRLLCTFYDSKDRVVFIKECFLPRGRMVPGEVQDFTLKVLMDSYLKEFTHFHFEIFFEDEIKVNI